MKAANYKRIKADISLFSVALIWGLTFVTVKNAVADMAPYTFIAIRFAIAFLFMAFFCYDKLFQIEMKTLFSGALLGVLLFLGYSFQTIGLQYTTASNAGFITGLSVILVPLIYALINRKLPHLLVLVGAVSAGGGIGLLCLQEGYTYNPGDIIVLFCAVFFALHIIFVGRFAPKIDATVLASIQIGTVAILSGIASLFFEIHIPLRFTSAVWIGLLTTAIPATSLAFFIQSSMQRYTTPMHTAVIFSLEPVFAGIFGYLLLGEVLGTKGLWGAALVFLGMVLSEINEVSRDSSEELSFSSLGHESSRT